MGLADLFCGLWRALYRLYELECRSWSRMEMLSCRRVGSGGCMLPERRWVCLERESGCGELLQGIGGPERASL